MHGNCIFCVYGDVDDALPYPEEYDAEGRTLPSQEKIECEHKWDKHLEKASGKDGEKFREKKRECVPSFVKDEIDSVEKVP